MRYYASYPARRVQTELFGGYLATGIATAINNYPLLLNYMDGQIEGGRRVAFQILTKKLGD
jgi:hypothetical protein